jgi:hypothetical protein
MASREERLRETVDSKDLSMLVAEYGQGAIVAALAEPLDAALSSVYLH